MDAKVALLTVVTGAGIALLMTWALEWREHRRSQPTFRPNRRMSSSLGPFLVPPATLER
jgi:hypothetical protein